MTPLASLETIIDALSLQGELFLSTLNCIMSINAWAYKCLRIPTLINSASASQFEIFLNSRCYKPLILLLVII